LIDFVPETGSTNADLLARIADGERVPEGYWLVAGRQTSGRGRQGRRWLDAAGNFMGSTVVHLTGQDPPPATLSFVSALAVYEAVLPYLPGSREILLKWPNDVLLGGAKFCGLLLEREGTSAVIGIGINLAIAPDVADRRTRAVSEFAPSPGVETFAYRLAEQFDVELARWRQFGLEPILNRWRVAAHPLGTPLTAHEPNGTLVSGTFDGLEPDGALRLRLEDGTARVIHAGDVTLGDT
jgi:BirA family transcriptional regulator, biotin operon repressor / biotin---[acetyl-CoA-carboxylase] ligase